MKALTGSLAGSETEISDDQKTIAAGTMNLIIDVGAAAGHSLPSGQETPKLTMTSYLASRA
jgi:hypothetical protein